MSFDLEFTQLSPDPAPQGLEKAAEIYVSNTFDISAQVKASADLLLFVESSDMSEGLRDLFFQVIEVKPQKVTEK